MGFHKIFKNMEAQKNTTQTQTLESLNISKTSNILDIIKKFESDQSIHVNIKNSILSQIHTSFSTLNEMAANKLRCLEKDIIANKEKKNKMYDELTVKQNKKNEVKNEIKAESENLEYIKTTAKKITEEE